MLSRRNAFSFLSYLSTLAKPAWGATRRPWRVFSYPPPFTFKVSGETIFAPIVSDWWQITSGFPLIDEIDGVVATLYWSDIEPIRGRLQIDNIVAMLDYWHARGKQVVIGVAAVGYPIFRETNGEVEFRGATPGWVLAECQTYVEKIKVIGPAHPLLTYPRTIDAVLPIYWDSRFLEEISGLVQMLSQIDGHPALATVRLTLGITGEDNPTFDGLRSAMPGFSNKAWVNYCRSIDLLFSTFFKRTMLEIDIDRLGWVGAVGSAADQERVDTFLNSLSHRGYWIAMNGFDPTNILGWERQEKTGPSMSLSLLEWHHSKGGKIGVEMGPVSSLNNSGLQVIMRGLEEVSPMRLVVIGDVAAILDFLRNGSSSRTTSMERIMGRAGIMAASVRAQQLLSSN